MLQVNISLHTQLLLGNHDINTAFMNFECLIILLSVKPSVLPHTDLLTTAL